MITEQDRHESLPYKRDAKFYSKKGSGIYVYEKDFSNSSISVTIGGKEK